VLVKFTGSLSLRDWLTVNAELYLFTVI